MLMRRNVAAGIGSNEQGEYCRAALQRSDRKEPRYKWPTLLLLYFYRWYQIVSQRGTPRVPFRSTIAATPFTVRRFRVHPTASVLLTGALM